MKGEKPQNSTSQDASSGGTTDGTSRKPVALSQLQITKNLVVICTGFLLFFTSYNGLSMLQSTMNQNQGIGVASQAIIYAGFCISASLFPKYTIRKLGCKRALLLSMSCYIPYIAANFYFSWVIMVPSAVLVGLAASVLWSSNCTYMTASAENYSNVVIRKTCEKRKNFNGEISGAKSGVDCESRGNNARSSGKSTGLEVLNCRTLDCHDVECSAKHNNAALYSNNDMSVESEGSGKDALNGEAKYDSGRKNTTCSAPSLHVPRKYKTDLQTHSNDNSSGVLSRDERSKIMSSTTAVIFGFAGLAHRSTDIWSNLMSYYILQQGNSVIDNLTESGNCSCGAAFCNAESKCFEHNLAEPDPEMRNILTGISVLLMCLSIMMIFLFLDELETDKEPTKFSFDLLMATCKFVAKKEALLLFPLSSYIGFQQGFYIGDFTKSYIACAWGVYHVGLVTVAYGVAAGISSTLSGLLVKHVGRMAVILGGGAINAGICTYLLLWNPLPTRQSLFFVSAAFWGTAIGILWSQLRAFYGLIFKNDLEVAFAGFYLWDAIGYTIAFSYSNYICTYLKIYILLAVSTVGIVGYVRTEMIYKRRKAVCES